VNVGGAFSIFEEDERVTFGESHAAFIDDHLGRRSGERKGRLARGHQHGEQLFLRNVWWPLQGNFNELHPEYEVLDWRGRSYFADFAWLSGLVKLLIEIKGFATHVRDMDRQKHSNEVNRETFLHAMGYQVVCFAFDDVKERPELCITLLRMVLSRYLSHPAPVSRALLAEKEIIRLGIRLAQPIRPKDVELHLDVDHKTAVVMLQKLCAKGWLLPCYGRSSKRVVRYELARGVLDYLD
jgi:hypothetical protein